MSERDQTQSDLYQLKGMISELPEDDRIRVTVIANTLRNVLEAGGQQAVIAFSLVGLELQLKA